MIVRLAQFIKLAFVALLRTAFESDVVPEEYRYNADEKLSKLQIYREFPRRIFRPPCIVVTANAGDANIQVLGEEERFFETQEDKTVGGLITIPINIKVYAATTTDRENLTDLLVFLIRFVFRNKLNKSNIHYKRIRILGEAKEEWQNQSIYTNGITVDCITENQYIIPEKLIDIIEKINLDVAVKELEIG